MWLIGLCSISAQANAFTYGVSLPAAPAGFIWQAATTGSMWNSNSQNLDLMPINSGFIDAVNSYDQSQLVLNQPFNISIPAFSVADLPDRFLLVTSQSVITSIQYSARDVFTSASPIAGSVFDVTRSGNVDFDAVATAGGSFDSTVSPTSSYQLSLDPLQAKTSAYFLSASSSAFLTGSSIDIGSVGVNGNVSSISHQLEVTTTPAGLVIVGSEALSATARLYNELNYTRYELVAIPEPSAVLLGGFGLFALFRRQRNA